MQRIGSREFKNRMGRYLSAVRAGQSLLITDRGKLVAKVSPPESHEQATTSLKERLRELEASGKIRLGTGPLRKFKAIEGKGKRASTMLIEDRR
jgi:prevent-host-death family protein